MTLCWGGDDSNIGSVLSPHLVGFMKPGKLRKKTRASLLLMCITVLLTATDTSSLARLRLGGQNVCSDSDLFDSSWRGSTKKK